MVRKPITIAVDRFTPFSVPELLKLKKACVRGLPVGAIIAYIGRHTRGLANGITPQDLKNYVDHGFKVIFNFEGASNHRAYFNAQEGKRDGTDVVKEFAWLGVKPDKEIIVYDSVDYDACTQADFQAVDAYQAAFVTALSDQFSDGEYGGITILKHSNGSKHAPSGDWQTIAWSDNKKLPGIKMYQVEVDAWVAGMRCDVNEVYEDPGWYPRPLVQTKPSEGASKMQTGNVKVNGQDFPGAVVDGSWYVKYTALTSLSGATMTRGTDGDVEITVPAPTAPAQAPAAAAQSTDSPAPQAAPSDGGWTIENRPVLDFAFAVEDVQNPNDAKQTLKAVHAQMLLGSQPWKTPGIPVTVSVNTVHGVLDNQTITTDNNGVATYEFGPDMFPGFVWINMSAQGNLTEGQLVTGKIRVECN